MSGTDFFYVFEINFCVEREMIEKQNLPIAGI